MRYLFLVPLLLASSLYAMTPISNDYSDQTATFVEFRNVFDNGQDRSFTQVTSTPNVTDLRDGEMVIYASTPMAQNVVLMLRNGTTIYASPNFQIIKSR